MFRIRDIIDKYKFKLTENILFIGLLLPAASLAVRSRSVSGWRRLTKTFHIPDAAKENKCTFCTEQAETQSVIRAGTLHASGKYLACPDLYKKTLNVNND